MSGIISFIMPAYKSLYLEEAIQSIVSQTSPKWELVVVDDCSQEDLQSIVEQFNDPRITYYRNEENIGGKNLVAQWNHSISFAKGDWIVLAGDDDVYDKRFCEEIARLAISYPEANIIRSRVEQIDQNGRHIWDDMSFPEYSNRYEFINGWLTGKVFTCVGNYAIRRTALELVGGFMEFPCGFCSDVATPLLLAENGVPNTADLLFKFRQSPFHLSGDQTRLGDKLSATTQFYSWLDTFEYPAPVELSDIENYSVKNHAYLHTKCLYDYFNQVLKYLPFTEMLRSLRRCTNASLTDKCILVLRWIKDFFACILSNKSTR